MGEGVWLSEFCERLGCFFLIDLAFIIVLSLRKCLLGQFPTLLGGSGIASLTVRAARPRDVLCFYDCLIVLCFTTGVLAISFKGCVQVSYHFRAAWPPFSLNFAFFLRLIMEGDEFGLVASCRIPHSSPSLVLASMPPQVYFHFSMVWQDMSTPSLAGGAMPCLPRRRTCSIKKKKKKKKKKIFFSLFHSSPLIVS